MTAEEFWFSTSRELAAHIKTMERDSSSLAHVLAALYNGPLVRKDKALWTAEMLLGGEQAEPKPDESWKTMKAQLAQVRRKPTADDRAELHRQQMEYSQRASRAAAAQASGASREVVMALMEDFNAG